MFVAVARLTLSIPGSNSLKSKRQVVHRLLDKVKARFNVSIAEVADQDLWQKATIGISSVANEHAFAQESLDKVIRFIEELYIAPVTGRSSEVIPIGDELYGEDDGTSFGSGARGTSRTLADAEGLPEHEELPRMSGRTWNSGGRQGGRAPQKAMSEPEREQAIEELRQRLRDARRKAAEDQGRDEGED